MRSAATGTSLPGDAIPIAVPENGYQATMAHTASPDINAGPGGTIGGGADPGQWVRVSFDTLWDHFASLYTCVGVASEDARLIGETLVLADARGVSTHGAIRVPQYIRKLRAGGLNPVPEIRIVEDALSAAVLHGDNGPGQVVCARAMELAISKARRTGIAMISVRESCHFGCAAYFSLMAAKQGLVGFVWSNGYPIMSAWQGRGNNISNSPMSWAIPAGRHRPIVFDASMSTVAAGKVRLAAKTGQGIPAGWILTADGSPTSDPRELTERGGSLLPMNMHKGYGLAVVGDVLASALGGGPFLGGLPLWFADAGQKTRYAHLVIAIDPAAFCRPEVFRDRVDAFIDGLKATPPASGYTEVLVPGEPEFRAETESRRIGVPIAAAVLHDLEVVAAEVGALPPPQPVRA